MIKYFYCHSYQIFNLALYYKNNLNEDVIVITEETNIIKACDYLHIKYFSHKKFIFRDWEFIKKVLSVKKELKRVINEVGESELHFSHTQSALFCLLLIHRFKGNMFYHDFEIIYPKYIFPLKKIRSYIRFFHMLLLRWIYWRIPLTLKKVNISGAMLGLMPEYIKQKHEVIHYEKSAYYDLTLKLFKTFKLDYPKIENLFIAQDHFIKPSKTSVEYNSKLSQLFDFLNTKKFVVKKHPKFNIPKELNDLEKLPDFLPVELFFNNVEKNVLSFHSSSLISASHFDNFKTVSLLELILDTKNDLLIEWKKEMVINSKNKIYFPITLGKLNTLALI